MPSDSGVTSSKRMSRLLTAEHARLNGGAPSATTSSGFTDLFGFLSEETLHHFLHFRNSRRTADQDDLFDVLG
jgi:hypothetical protein